MKMALYHFLTIVNKIQEWNNKILRSLVKENTAFLWKLGKDCKSEIRQMSVGNIF